MTGMTAPDPDSRHGELHLLLGGYLLGGLEQADLAAFEDHLPRCGRCRAELALHENLPRRLAVLPVPDAVALTMPAAALPPPEQMSVRILELVAAQRKKARRRRAGLVAAVSAASLAVGVLGGGLIGGPATEPPPVPAATVDESYSVSAADGPRVELGMVRKAWGTELSVQGQSLPKEGTLSVWVIGRDGTADRAASWAATPAGRARVTGATPTQLDGIASIEIRDAAARPVATIVCDTRQQERRAAAFSGAATAAET